MQVVSPSISLRGSLVTFHQPWVLGILNVTPDSFHDGGAHVAVNDAVAAADRMVAEGADALDLGAQSTKPGALPVDAATEWNRLEPVLHAVRERHPELPLSVDTFHARVAERALAAGADLVNDVSGGKADPDMWHVVAEARAPYVLMHMQGTPQTMQANPTYDDVVCDVREALEAAMHRAWDCGVGDVILDVGFGFGKRLEHNYELLRNLDVLAALGAPLLVGVSRKSMIQGVLGVDSRGALNGTTALHAWALDRGAHVLRVHDVAAAREVVHLHNALHATRQTPPVA
jgi:dihydropteroate synthase